MLKSLLLEQQKGIDAMKQPNGADLLKTLIDLLADQEHVKITYELKEGECENAVFSRI